MLGGLHHRYLALTIRKRPVASRNDTRSTYELTAEVTWEHQQGSISMSTPTGENPNERPETESYARGTRMASDLDRLEALIVQHVREEWAPQLPRAAQLLPLPGLARAGERFDDHDPPAPWLKPEHLIIPPAIMRRRQRARRRWRTRILIVGVCALPMAYYFVGGWQPRSDTHSQLGCGFRRSRPGITG
jgi:hypothetical protein